MCIAVVKPANVNVRKKVLIECFRNNPDGVGFAYPSNTGKTVKVVKGYFSFRQFWRDYRAIQDRGVPMLIHFRVATSGKIDQDNCHPWRIDGQHAMIHNGVLEHKIGLKDDNVSDTGLFTEFLLKPIFQGNSEVWKDSSFKWLVEESIGVGNKVAILDNEGEVHIYNEKQGEWDHGVWFSNKTYKEKRIKRTTSYSPTKSNYTLPAPPTLALPAPKSKDKAPFQMPTPPPLPKKTQAQQGPACAIASSTPGSTGITSTRVDLSKVY